MNTKPPSYAEFMEEIFAIADGPISIADLEAQLLLKKASTAKNPHQAILTKIRAEEGQQLIFLDEQHILPLRLAMKGARYRIRMTRETVDQCALSIYEHFRYYLPRFFNDPEIRIIDAHGDPIPCQIQNLPQKPLFPMDILRNPTAPTLILHEWFRSQKMYFKDHILVTIEDWEKGIFRLEHEKFGEQRADLLKERNKLIADLLFSMLEKAKSEDIYAHNAILTAYAIIPDKSGYPPDHWAYIIANDPRLATDGFLIHDSGKALSPFERMMGAAAGIAPTSPQKAISKEQKQKIYRFHVQLANKPSIWREIELRGKQTLSDLDGDLRITFGHDPTDHLSGFWQLVARKGDKRKRYHEVDIATLDPFGSGEGSDTSIAALELQVGDQLKYVYDFGDWVEHTLKLVSISDPEKGVKYPRETARNEPQYEYCVECQKKGKQTVATWVCHTCSDEQQVDILLCEACLELHEDHYVDEILY